MKTSPLILKDWFATFDTAFPVLTVTVLTSTSFLLGLQCHTYNTYAFVGMPVTVKHNTTTYTYEVSAISACGLTISGNAYVPVVADIFKQVLPSFIHGTQKKVKPELDAMIQRGSITYPLIYLQEILSEKYVNDPSISVSRYSQIRMWFLLPSNKAWITDQHYDNAIEAMKGLANEVMRQLAYDCIILDLTEYELILHANIGSSSDTGHLKDLLNTQHSGVLLYSNFPFLKQVC